VKISNLARDSCVPQSEVSYCTETLTDNLSLLNSGRQSDRDKNNESGRNVISEFPPDTYKYLNEDINVALHENLQVPDSNASNCTLY
jgi:hypothetical protein